MKNVIANRQFWRLFTDFFHFLKNQIRFHTIESNKFQIRALCLGKKDVRKSTIRLELKFYNFFYHKQLVATCNVQISKVKLTRNSQCWQKYWKLRKYLNFVLLLCCLWQRNKLCLLLWWQPKYVQNIVINDLNSRKFC